MVRRSLAVRGGVLSLALGVLVTGCATGSEPSPPSGVDELVIPTPSVDPRDFVGRIDNPWLPYAPGATWTYQVAGAAAGSAGGTLTITVRKATETVDGVTATVVDRTDPRGATTTDLFAQDRRGNVWWFGREGVWEAGEDGAEAGLAMPATPREGDGWREAFAEGAVEDQAAVTSLDGNAATQAGLFGGLLVLETTSPLDSAPGLRSYYGRGVGLVEQVGTGVPGFVATLVSAPSAG